MMAIFLIWRIVIFMVGYFASLRFPDNLDVPFHQGVWPILSIWSVYDVDWYTTIAEFGYLINPHTYVFFPLYPMLVRIFSHLQINFDLSAMLVSNIFLFLSLIFFYKLVRLDYSEELSWRTIIYLLLFPTAFYLGVGYTESLYLFLVLASFYFARQNKWILAGIMAGFLSATRLVGVIMFVVLIVEYLEQIKWNLKKIKLNILAILLAPIGLITYMYLLYNRLQDPLKFLSAYENSDWDRSPLNLQVFKTIVDNIKEIVNFSKILNLDFTYYYAIIDTLPLLLFIGLGVWILIKVRKSYATFIFLSLLPPLLSGSLTSINRFLLVLFPAFIVLAIIGENKYINWLIVVFSSLMLGAFVSAFVNGWWVA